MRTFSQLVIAIAAFGALVVSIYNANQINVVHVSINSRMDQLLKATASESKAEGIEQERDRKKVK